MFILNNEAMYNMFVSTLSKMSDQELKNALSKAKNMLSESDYNSLLAIIEKEKSKKK